MHIDQAEVYYAVLPLHSPWATAYGSDPAVHSILVKLVSGEHEGWGETTPLYAPCYSPESSIGVFQTLKEYLAPQIVGQELASARDLCCRLQHFKGNFFAKAGLEIAWWVLEARMQERPLHKLLGGTRDIIECGMVHGIKETVELLLKAVQEGIDQGYKRSKLKFSRDWGLDVLKTVRSTFPDHTFHIDCNADFTLDDLPMFREIDKLGLAMIEQPLNYDDLVEHAKLQAALETPVCLDESIHSVRDMRLAVELKACRYVNIKTGRVGGLQAALDIHDLARDNGIPAWVGGMLESSLGKSINVELATLDNFVYPHDIRPTLKSIKQDVSATSLDFPGSARALPPSSVPGVPFIPCKEKLKRVTKKHFILSE